MTIALGFIVLLSPIYFAVLLTSRASRQTKVVGTLVAAAALLIVPIIVLWLGY